VNNLFSAAGDAFCHAAKVQLKCGSKHEAATQYVDASTCYKKADPAGNAAVSVKLFWVAFNSYCICLLSFILHVRCFSSFFILCHLCCYFCSSIRNDNSYYK